MQYALRYILIDLIILINGQIVQFIIQTLTAEVHYNENKTILWYILYMLRVIQRENKN